MSDPQEIRDALARVEDAFHHGSGTPDFEPKLDATGEATEGRVVLQKGCRHLEAASTRLLAADFYTSVIEASFATIERTLEGYLVLVAGDDPELLRDHVVPYERARVQVPLERETIDAIEHLYGSRRTSYYYGTAVATRRQAESLLELAGAVHDHIVGFDHELRDACICGDRVRTRS